ncbi:MAG: response regulator [Alphaproteobacteria bacterium]|nr:response regulator [Alphaproteobacteria bacterium]MCB9975607.1 response regulator [Rhodospirillales bacterium]
MMEKLHILIVDDDPAMREKIHDYSQALLFASDLNIETANNAQEALMKLQNAGGNEIDLVVTDNSMPGLSGAELAQRIRSNKYLNGIPIVMCTGDPEFERVKDIAINSGVNVVMHVPHSADDLLESYREVLPPAAFEDPMGGDSKAHKPDLVDTRDPDPGHTPEYG